MKKVLVFALIVFISSVNAPRAEAIDQFIGAKTGLMLIDVGGVDDIIPLGVVYGQRIQDNFWIEGEFNLGLIGGDVSGGGDFDIWTLAGYGVYRHPLNDQAYLKGKLGLLYERVEYDSNFFGIPVSASDNDFGLSLGVGGGLKIDDRISAEAELTIIESDVTFLSVGLNFKL